MGALIKLGKRDKYLYLLYDEKSDLFRLGSSVKEPRPEQVKLVCSYFEAVEEFLNKDLH